MKHFRLSWPGRMTTDRLLREVQTTGEAVLVNTGRSGSVVVVPFDERLEDLALVHADRYVRARAEAEADLKAGRTVALGELDQMLELDAVDAEEMTIDLHEDVETVFARMLKPDAEGSRGWAFERADVVSDDSYVIQLKVQQSSQRERPWFIAFAQRESTPQEVGAESLRIVLQQLGESHTRVFISHSRKSDAEGGPGTGDPKSVLDHLMRGTKP